MDMKLEVGGARVGRRQGETLLRDAIGVAGGRRLLGRRRLSSHLAHAARLPMLDHLRREITSATPGSVDRLTLVVDDIDKAGAALVGRGVDVSEVFHDEGGVWRHSGTVARVAGPDPPHRSYPSFAAFSDPDGNGWLVQAITERLPGR